MIDSHLKSIGVTVQPMPVVGAEVRRIHIAFDSVSRDLAAVQTVLRDLGPDSVGTPSSDPAVLAGMADLGRALGRLQSTADGCVQAIGRHRELAEPSAAQVPPQGATDEA